MKPEDMAHSVDLQALSLDAALRLIRHSGHPVNAEGTAPQLYVQAVIDALCSLSSHDALTGLANRHIFTQAIDRELDRVSRLGSVALLLMVDMDHFKRVNDTHGHVVGDEVLKQLAQRLQECVRPMDTVARFGGEEFALVLPNCSYAYGELVAERIRQAIKGRPFTVAPGLELHLTVSIGGAYAPQWIRSEAAIWIERADRQLYRAKREGRNRVCLEEVTGRPPMEYVPAIPADPLRALILGVTSGKGGVGKTLVATNLAAALSAQGLRVVLLDADLGMVNVHTWLNLEREVTLGDVFAEKSTLAHALLPAPGGFRVLQAGAGLMEHARMTSDVRDRLYAVVMALSRQADVIVMDNGAGFSDVALYANSLADEILMVSTTEPSALADALFTVNLLAQQQGRRSLGLVLNQTLPSDDGEAITARMVRGTERRLSQLADGHVTLTHWGDIPTDASVRVAAKQRELLLSSVPASGAAQSLVRLADRVRALLRQWRATPPAQAEGV